MKQCKKCNEKIPYRILIDGKFYNLQNRKFCVACSPFKQHNTRSNIDDIVHRPMSSGKRPYALWSEEAKDENRARIYWRGRSRKAALIKFKGGCCEICGYNKCSRSLTFHHINPKDKLLTLDTRNLQMETWDSLLSEVKKCQLLCFNCHMEIEHIDDLDLKYARFADRFFNAPEET